MVTRFNNVNDLIEDSFTKYRNHSAYTCAGKTLSYQQLDELSQRFASFLQHDLGLQHGDRVALQMPNILQYPVAMYGVIRAGLVVVNTNPLYTARELKHQLKDSGAKALVVLSNVADVAAKVVQDTEVEHVIVTDFADLHSAPKRQLINFVVKYVQRMVPAFTFKKALSFRQSIAKPAQALKAFKPDADTLFALQYTGGTTGVSKGAMLTQGNLASNVWQMVSHMTCAFREGEEVFIACLPLYHIYGFNLHGLCAFSFGEHNVLIPNPRDIKSMASALRKVQMTVFIGINTLYVAVTRNEEFRKLDFSKLHVSSAGGMAMTVDAAKAWEKLTGCQVCEGYGLTETSPVVTGNHMDNIQLGTIGAPVPETEMKLIDEQGATVPEGEVGELCVRGPQVMKGYWQRPQDSAEILSEDGWLRTGDMALRRPDGYFKLVDRKKDMILVSGFNVYPNEIEDVVSLHPGVVEAAAIGIADERSGEVVKLFVVRTDDSITVEDISAHCHENLTGYKCPKEIVFCDNLPKTNVGKILRRELRDKATAAA